MCDLVYHDIRKYRKCPLTGKGYKFRTSLSLSFTNI